MTLPDSVTRVSQARYCLRAAALAAAAAAWLLLSAAAAALGLGDIVQQSALGEPFRAAIRVVADADDVARGELSPECFRLVGASSDRSDGLAHLAFGRTTLAQGADGVQIIVASDAAASDPALSFAVEAGCQVRVRREYTALLDPPILHEAEAASVASRATIPAVRTAPPTTSVRRSAAAARSSSPRHGRHTASTSTIAANRARASRVGSIGKADGPRLAEGAHRDAAPRLRVSRSTDAGGDALVRKKTDAEIRQELEAETIVLQRRIAELSVTLATLDEELRAARAARDAARRRSAAAVSPPRATGSWHLPALIAAIALALLTIAVRALRKPRLRSIGLSGLVSSTLGPTQSETAADEALNHGVAPAPASPAPVDADHSLQSAVTEPPGHDDETSFDDDLIRYAEQRSAYSVLERDQPKVVAALVREWGKPKAIAYLRNLLVSPLKPRPAFSREAVSDLRFLQALAMARAGYRADDHPWRIEVGARRRA
ncbi:MAG TPA: hypothetical protein VL742_06955 [Casimicrobiaceae bacterium]|nr:hypothetical protein [Casimicrobiaceae bacterium]